MFVAVSAGAGVLPCLVLTARRQARLTGRGAYERCARQLTFLGLCFGLVLTPAGFGVLYASGQGLIRLPEFLSRLGVLLPLAPWLAGLAIAAGVMCLGLRLVAVRSWAATCLAVGAVGCTWTLLAAGGALGLGLTLPARDFAALFPADGALDLVRGLTEVAAVRPLGAAGLFVGLIHLGWATAGGLALMVQIFRRSLDDYGRDYYLLAARWCAWWAGVGGSGLALFSLSLSWRLARLDGVLWMWTAACAGIMLASTLAWLGIARSDNPLRLKVLMFAAVLGLVLYLAGGAILTATCLALIPA